MEEFFAHYRLVATILLLEGYHLLDVRLLLVLDLVKPFAHLILLHLTLQDQIVEDLYR